MPKFRSRIIEKEAVRWMGNNVEEILAFLGIDITEFMKISTQQGSIPLQTLQGEQMAHVYDWIIKGIGGEFYPCNDEIFRKTYIAADWVGHFPGEGSPMTDEINDIDGFFRIKFQTGPLGETERNGTTIERILQVAWDRLQGFQAGAFACYENETAIAGINMAIEALRRRTIARQEQGVEGKSLPHVSKEG